MGLAQRKHFPSGNWNISFSKYIRVLEPFFQDYDPEYQMLQQKMKEILQKEDDLQEIVQLVGKDSLSEDQKCTLEIAKIVREDFLQQNGFVPYDFMCPLAKTIGMMRCIATFHELAQKAIASGSGDNRISWADIYSTSSTHTGKCNDQYYALTQMKFHAPKRGDPKKGETVTPVSDAEFKQIFKGINDDIVQAFEKLGQ